MPNLFDKMTFGLICMCMIITITSTCTTVHYKRAYNQTLEAVDNLEETVTNLRQWSTKLNVTLREWDDTHRKILQDRDNAYKMLLDKAMSDPKFKDWALTVAPVDVYQLLQSSDKVQDDQTGDTGSLATPMRGSGAKPTNDKR